MANYSGALKKFREAGYSKSGSGDGKPESDDMGGTRTIKLTDDERKELEPYKEKYGGDEIVIEVTGRLEEHGFRISSLKYAESPEGDQDVNADAEEMMSKYRQGNMVQSQTIPSPS